jgi:hypothetical protein
VRTSIRSLVTGLVCMIAIGIARPAAAQGELSGGYQYFAGKGETADDTWEKFPAGWYADVAAPLSSSVGVVGQVSGNYKHFDADDFDFRIHTFMGGVRVGSRGPVRGFGQVLVGGANLKAIAAAESVSETDLAIQFGAGVTMMGGGNVGLRVGADYLRIFAKDGGQLSSGEDLNGLRFIAGVVLGFGS